jgi:hypothetical protein
MGMPAKGVIAMPEFGEPASQVIASCRLVSFILSEVEAPEFPNRSILQLALLIVGTVKS